MREAFALRIWIIDNSTSMKEQDGHQIVSRDSRTWVSLKPCSRWEEIVECVQYHIQLASLIDAPTRFRLLNNPDGTSNTNFKQFSVAEDLNNDQMEDAMRTIGNTRPHGCTPLTRHIQEIHRDVSEMAPELTRVGGKVVIVIATDGLPSNSQGQTSNRDKKEFVESLRQLEGLPVWVVVRLCTDDEAVVDFYNDLDTQLELSLE
jgi:hypothetical protein